MEKEVKDLLRDPRIYIGLIVPVVMLPLMGVALSAVAQSTGEAAAKDLRVALLDRDATEASGSFASLLTGMGLNMTPLSADSLDDALEEAKGLKSKALLVIPEGFEERLLSFGRAEVEVYSMVESVGLGAAGTYAVMDGVLAKSSEMLSIMLISKLAPGVRPDAVREPLNITRHTVIKDRVMEAPPQAVFGQLMVGYGLIVPLVLVILAITVTQIAATATAVENEEKTLETLLTFPVTRYDILMAKLLGSSTVAVLGGVLFTAGFLLYLEGMSAFAGLGAGNVFVSLPPPPPLAYAVLALSLILSILFITSLGIVIGALSSDVRMSGSLLGVVIVPVLIPSLLIIYGDLRALPLGLQLLAYALPTSYPMVMSKEMVFSTIPVEVLYGIPYSAALTLIVLYATSKLLAPEKLLTLQHRLRLRRTRKRPERELE
ncbi:MAG: ABC transporter permease [Candidatus Bathyarchaeia archaeon]